MGAQRAGLVGDNVSLLSADTRGSARCAPISSPVRLLGLPPQGDIPAVSLPSGAEEHADDSFADYDPRRGACRATRSVTTSPGAWRDHSDTLAASVRNFRELTDADSLAAEPARLSIVEVGQRQQLRGVLEAHPEVSVGEQTVAILNHRELDDLIPAGSLIKLVFGGPQQP